MTTLRSIMTRVALVGGLTVAAAAPAHAQFLSGAGCTGNAFTFCASWSFTKTADNQFSLALTNTSNGAPANNANSNFTQIIIGGTTLADPTGFSFSSNDVGADFSYDANPNGFNGFGLLDNNFGALSNMGINGALGAGKTATFVFTYGTNVFAGLTNSQIVSTYFQSAQIGIHDQGGGAVPGACASSAKGVMDAATGIPTRGSANICTPPSTVPEPSTYALMGTGLMALAGFAVRRRQTV